MSDLTATLSRRRFGSVLRLGAVALLAGGLLAAAPLAAPAYAVDQSSTADINVDETGLAIRGYDPVAYFTLGAPTEGDPALTAQHNGATYRFANAEHLALFQGDPDKYAPAYGGFCAIGTSFGRKFDGDPMLWNITDGRLFLNVQPGPHQRFLSEKEAAIARADENWPKIKDKAPKDL